MVIRRNHQTVGTDLSSVVEIQNQEGIDVVVIAKDEWQHLLELLDARHDTRLSNRSRTANGYID